MNFRVGQKVVCVGLDYSAHGGVPEPPSGAIIPDLNKVYTIRRIDHWPHVTLILLEEINNEHLIQVMKCGIEPGFDIRGFRPVVEGKTDISIFEKMLTPSGIRKAKKELV